MNIVKIPVDKIREPQIEMRQYMSHEGMEELIESIREIGLQQPITVVVSGDGFEVVAGARRLYALRQIGLTDAPCVIVEGGAREIELRKIHENLKRESVDPIEEGHYYKRIINERGFSVDDIIKMSGRGGAYIEGRIGLTELDEQIQAAISSKQVSIAVGKELQKFRDSEAIRQYLQITIAGGASASTVDGWRQTWERDRRAAQECGIEPATPAEVVRASVPSVHCHACGRNLSGMVVMYVPVDQFCHGAMVDELHRANNSASADSASAPPSGGAV